MGSMKIALLFFAYCFIFFSAVAAAPDPFYVWADSSCRTPQRQANFDKALAGALNIHKQGYNRIVGIPDPLTAGNFQKLFDGPPFDPTLRSLVESALGAPAPKYGVALWQELKVPSDVDPTSQRFKQLSEENRKKSNVRIYCDNDAQNPNGGTRWRIWPDRPPERWDANYIPNSRKPRFDTPGSVAPFQLWVDDENGLQTIHSGCQNQGMLGYTHNDMWKTPPGQPTVRTVITLCDIMIDGKLHSVDDLADKDIAQFLQDNQQQEVHVLTPTPIDAFTANTAFVLAHEFLHANPHKIPDQKATLPGSGPGRGAYTWPELLHLPTANKRQNVNNFAYFSLLATIQGLKWRLAPEEADWRMGKIVQDQSITRRSSTAPLRESCSKQDHDDHDAGSGWSNGKACIEFEG